MNFVMIAGNLGKDAEVRVTTNGDKILILTIATTVRKGGKDETIWWRVTAWDCDRYEKMIPYLTKGKPIIVGGDLMKPEMYTDKNGKQQISSLEVRAEFIRFSPFNRPERENQEGAQQAGNSPGAYQVGARGMNASAMPSFGAPDEMMQYGLSGSHHDSNMSEDPPF